LIDFNSPAAASNALSLNGSIIPNTSRPFKLEWASVGSQPDRGSELPIPQLLYCRCETLTDCPFSNRCRSEFSIFVGGLGPEVDERILVSTFRTRYPSCKSAKIICDPIYGLSRGYGFVRFIDESDQQRALTEMHGVFCGNRPMRISTAHPKHESGGGRPSLPAAGRIYSAGSAPPPACYGTPPLLNQFTDPNNTTVFIGGLSGYVTKDELRSFFQAFGEIVYVSIPPGKSCGFIQFVHRSAAEMAMNQMQGYPIGNSRIRLSWGRSQNNAGPPGTPYKPTPPLHQRAGLPLSQPYGNIGPYQ
jgi:RNA recognition motif-containing protein